MGVLRWVVVAVLVPVFVVLVSGCGLFDMTGRRLAKDIEKIDGVAEVRVLERRKDGVGDKYLDMTCTFDSGLSPEELGAAITGVNVLADASEIKVERNRLVFDERREYKGMKLLLDPSTGILQAVGPFPAYQLGAGSSSEGSNKAVGYGVDVPSEAVDLVSFGAEVAGILDAFADAQRSGLVESVGVKAEGEGFLERGNFSFATIGAMDQETADLFAKVVANPDSRIVGLYFSVSARDNKHLVRVLTDGRHDEVAQFLHSLAVDSPLDVEVDAVGLGGGSSWFSEVG